MIDFECCETVFARMFIPSSHPKVQTRGRAPSDNETPTGGRSPFIACRSTIVVAWDPLFCALDTYLTFTLRLTSNGPVTYTEIAGMSAPSTYSDCFTISQLARELDISTRAIRFYEEKGLISPRRTPGNQRAYSKRDRARLKLILRGKRFGYSLHEIAEMIGLTDVDMEEREQIQKSLAYGDKKLTEILERISELQELAAELTDLRAKLVQRLREIDG